MKVQKENNLNPISISSHRHTNISEKLKEILDRNNFFYQNYCFFTSGYVSTDASSDFENMSNINSTNIKSSNSPMIMTCGTYRKLEYQSFVHSGLTVAVPLNHNFFMRFDSSFYIQEHSSIINYKILPKIMYFWNEKTCYELNLPNSAKNAKFKGTYKDSNNALWKASIQGFYSKKIFQLDGPWVFRCSRTSSSGTKISISNKSSNFPFISCKATIPITKYVQVEVNPKISPSTFRSVVKIQTNYIPRIIPSLSLLIYKKNVRWSLDIDAEISSSISLGFKACQLTKNIGMFCFGIKFYDLYVGIPLGLAYFKEDSETSLGLKGLSAFMVLFAGLIFKGARQFALQYEKKNKSNDALPGVSKKTRKDALSKLISAIAQRSYENEVNGNGLVINLAFWGNQSSIEMLGKNQEEALNIFKSNPKLNIEDSTMILRSFVVNSKLIMNEKNKNFYGLIPEGLRSSTHFWVNYTINGKEETKIFKSIDELNIKNQIELA